MVICEEQPDEQGSNMDNDDDIKRLRNMIAYADLGDCDPDVLSRLLEALLLSQGKIRAALLRPMMPL